MGGDELEKKGAVHRVEAVEAAVEEAVQPGAVETAVGAVDRRVAGRCCRSPTRRGGGGAAGGGPSKTGLSSGWQ